MDALGGAHLVSGLPQTGSCTVRADAPSSGQGAALLGMAREFSPMM